jgi:L-Ala-D/L-Glu epimerase
VRLEVRERRLRFARPVRTAYGTLEQRDVLELALTDAGGVSGYGEAAPLEPYDGVPLASVREALDAYAPVLEATSDLGALVDGCRQIADLPQAIAAVDMAVWDLVARHIGKPVAHLLAADVPLSSVDVNATIDALAPEEAAEDAARAVGAGFRTLKVKVGTPDDRVRVAAVRDAAGSGVALRLDANGAWTVDQAVRAIDELAAFDLELVEEPVHGVDALRAVRKRVEVPIGMDETASEPGAAASAAADAVCLKVASCGGISGMIARSVEARDAGSRVYVASTYDGPIGIAAALHCAAALFPDLACGLATLNDFTDSPPTALLPVAGMMEIPDAPGLIAVPAG